MKRAYGALDDLAKASRVYPMSTHALEKFRERYDKEKTQFPDDEGLATFLGESVAAAWSAGAYVKILDEGAEAYWLDLRPAIGADLGAFLRDDNRGTGKQVIVTVLESYMAGENIRGGKWTDRQGKPLDLDALTPLKVKPLAAKLAALDLLGVANDKVAASKAASKEKTMKKHVPPVSPTTIPSNAAIIAAAAAVMSPPAPEPKRFVIYEATDGLGAGNFVVEELPKSQVGTRLAELFHEGKNPRVAAPMNYRIAVEVDDP